MDFASRSAQQLHNQVRAFAGWPGTSADFVIAPPGAASARDAGGERVPLKVLATRVADAAELPADAAAAGRVAFAAGGRMLVPCGGGGALEVLQLQQPTKKAMRAGDFYNGLKGRAVFVAPPAAAEAVAGAAPGGAADAAAAAAARR